YIGELAVRAARAVNYRNAGTVEFLLDPEGRFYFMEMNTRLQVEHTVTEQITGIDVVQEQIRIAAGLPLSVSQADVSHRGYAIQFRINAEDPQNNFLPSFGRITRYYSPGGPGVRTDAAIYTGYEIPPYYDSLCAKLTVWALDWDQAVRRARRALNDMGLYGVKSTIPYYLEILNHPDFVQHRLDTTFVERHPELTRYASRRRPEWAAIIAVAIATREGL
ncbi:MAG: acetyl-CoA carboxylase biotin carboxylase subunit, partial [Pseudomonadota bacterium]